MHVKNIGSHAVDLDDGRVLQIGEDTKDVDADHPHNQRLLNEGFLIEVPEKKARNRKEDS